MTTIQEEVELLQKDAYSDGKNGKRVNADGKEQCHHCGKKDGHWINDCPDISPEKREQIKKDSAEWWENKNGHNHTQVGEVVDVLDVDLEGGAGLSMFLAGKKALGGNK